MEGVLAEKGLIGRSLTQRLRLGKRVGQRVLNLTDFLAHNLDDFDRLQPSLTGARRSGAEGPTKSEPFWGCHCQALRDIGFGKEACFWNEAIVVTGGSKRWWRRKLRIDEVEDGFQFDEVEESFKKEGDIFKEKMLVMEKIIPVIPYQLATRGSSSTQGIRRLPVGIHPRLLSLDNLIMSMIFLASIGEIFKVFFAPLKKVFRESRLFRYEVVFPALEALIMYLLNTNPVQNVETTFQLTRQEIELLQKTEYDVQVLNLIPKEPVGEQFEDAIARVCRCIGGGTAAENADSDSDLEVVADSVTVNLRCPMSGSRMKTAGRFKPCVHMGCFDLETFVELNQRSRKASNSICPFIYMFSIISVNCFNLVGQMRYCGEDVTEIDVKPDGSWRAKIENEHRDLAEWHLADGTLLVAADEDVKSNLETTKQIKQEGVSEGHTGLRIGIKKNRNGVWEVSRPEDMHTHFSGNPLQEKFEIHNHNQNVMPMSSSATGSGRDGEDYCVNQDIGGHFVFSANNGNELNSVSLNFDLTYGLNQNPCALLGDADVIVLSDSEEENEILIETVYGSDQADACGVTFSVPPPGVLDAYPEDSCFGTGGSSCPGLFNGLQDDYGMPLCPYPSGTQAGSGFQLFGTDMDVSDALVDVPHASITCPLPMNGYVLTPEATIGSATQVQDSSICCSSTDINESLVDNPLAFGRDDPSLQIFLPTQPAAASVQSDIRDQTDMLKDIRTEDWISLRLGGGDGGDSGGGHDESADANGLNSRNQFASKEGRMESLANIGVGPFF
ncbi:hypothetical protein HHK36_032399 [Tetracentron sinense]|uniref:SP-RING-type domain-containing protein n=1 Tax=Tetracentron sinense TaxID=13715 RepID=A0A834Y7Z5_TETSI|nr:hypothetical protein HHK36_032399 [Tetracentron sinense]